MKMHNPPHPGDVLRDISEGSNQSEMACRLGVTRQTLSRILNGHSSITAMMALRLAKEFPASTPELWLKLQMQYDLWQAMHTAPSLRVGSRKKVSRAAVTSHAA